MLKAKVILVVIIILVGYIYFTNPDGIVINEKNKVEGLFNKGRAIVQKSKFWNLQFERVNQKYKENIFPSESMASQMKEIDQNINNIDKELDTNTKEFYTSEEQTAQSLRREADRIEKQGTYREIDEIVESSRLEELEKCKILISIIESRLLNAKPSYTIISLLICVISFVSLVSITKFQKASKLTSK